MPSKQTIVRTAKTTLTLLLNYDAYVFTGSSPATWTLPVASSLSLVNLRRVINRGSANITLQRTSPQQLFTTSAVNSVTIAPGESAALDFDGTYWGVFLASALLAAGSSPTFAGLTLSSPLTVANGGTGAATFTGLLKGNGTGAFTAAVAGTDYLAPGQIGSTIQAFDPDLDSIAAISGTNTIPYRSAANTYGGVTVGSNLSFSGGTLNLSTTPNIGAATGTSLSTSGSVTVGTTSGLLQLAGTTSSFPALKRNATFVEARLADDSAYAPFRARAIGVSASSAHAPNNGEIRSDSLWLGTGPWVNFTCPSTGVMTLQNNAGTSFGRINFGGTTSSFAALKLNGTGLEVRLADDSAYAPFRASNLFAEGNIATTAGTDRQLIVNRSGNGDYARVMFLEAGSEIYSMGLRGADGGTYTFSLLGPASQSFPTLYTITPGSGTAGIFAFGMANISMANLPTIDPHVAGRLWRSTNDLKVSTG